jgi:glycerol uptake facilitator-like aquaporin
MTSAGSLPVTELFPYITAQMFGALVAHQLFIRFKI